MTMTMTMTNTDAATAGPAAESGGEPVSVGRGWPCLAAIVLAHLAVVRGLVAIGEPPGAATPSRIVGVLISAPRPSVDAPQPVPVPVPVPVKREFKSRPVVEPRQVPLAPPMNAPAAERATTAPPASAQPEAAPLAASPLAPPPGAARPEPPATSPSPVVPPRSDASHLNNPAPVYPNVSRRLGEQGRVLFDVYILPDGTVGEIKLKRSSGYARLDDAALIAVRAWRYVPARRGETPIPFWYAQPIAFALDG